MAVRNTYNPEYINVKLNKNSVEYFTVRHLLQKAIDERKMSWEGTVVDLACGEMPYRDYLLGTNKKIKKYIGVDIKYSSYHQKVKPDIYWNGKSIPIKSNCADVVLATEFFEHISNLTQVLKEIRRILKKNGTLFFTVPFLWPLHEVPNDEYRYTPFSLGRCLNKAGFRKFDIYPLGGYNASLAQQLGLWIPHYRQLVKNNLAKKTFFSFLGNGFLIFLMRKLMVLDKKIDQKQFTNSMMFTGFYGVVMK